MARSLPDISHLAPVIAHAIAVFGDEEKAMHWLTTSLPFFNCRAPRELLSNEESLASVEQTLTRIEHNIPS